MKNTKKVGIILLVLSLILIIMLILMITLLNKMKSTDYNNNTEFEKQILYEANKNIEKVSNRNKYYVVQDIVITYMKYINNLKKEDIKDKNTALYSILDKEYILEFNINENNIGEKFNLYTSNEKVYIDDIYELEKDISINIFFIYGTTINSNEAFKLIVKTDSKNNTFSVFPAEYIDRYGYSYSSNNDEIKIDDKEIEPNNYNIFEYKNINNDQMIVYYFEDLKNKVFEKDKLYQVLDEEYKNKKFANIQEYNNYLENIKSFIMQRNIVNYQINKFDNYTQYVCIDQMGKYYIFNETGVMDYTVILDTYTIELPQFTEQYNNSTDAEKVLLNIQKVFQAINDGDYEYVYNKLDNTFKQNNFPTLISFENYIKQNFYENNKVGYSNYKTSGDLHIYTLSITDNNNSNNSIEKDFIMQLKEETDFVMSFNV